MLREIGRGTEREIRTSPCRPAWWVVMVAAAICLWGRPALSAEEAEPKPAQKVATLKLTAKSIVFDRAKGEVNLEGKVVVIRKTADQVLTVECTRMTAKMKEGKVQSVLAIGDVVLTTEEYTAWATQADFDFEKNIIILYGGEDAPAEIQASGMRSTGPEIIFHLDTQQVELPKGGETEVDMSSPPGA
jgi:lipopolysaccharide export system protein LptA